MDSNERNILSATMLGHGTVHAYELAIPIFIPIWIAEYGVSAAVIGIVVSIGYALYGIGAIPGGFATDKIGSQSLIVLCLLGMGGSFLLLGMSDGLIGISLSLVVWGCAASLYHPTGLRLISTGIDNRGTAFGYHGIAGNVGIAFGPFAAALLLIGLDWRIVAIILAIPALAAAAYTYLLRMEERAAVESDDQGSISSEPAGGSGSNIAEFLSASKLLFTGGFILVFPIVILEGFFYRGLLTFLPDVLGMNPSLGSVTVVDWTVDPASYVFVGILVIGMFGQYVGGKVSDHVPPEKAAIGAFVLLGILSIIFIPVSQLGLGPLLLVGGLLGFVLFGEQPLLQALVANYSESNVRGLSYGYMFLGVFGIGALGATFSGFVLAYSTETYLFILLGLVPIIAACLAASLVYAVRRN